MRTYRVVRIAVRDVFHREPLNNLVHAIILSYASNSDAEAVIKLAIRDADVRAVAFE